MAARAGLCFHSQSLYHGEIGLVTCNAMFLISVMTDYLLPFYIYIYIYIYIYSNLDTVATQMESQKITAECSGCVVKEV